MTLSTTKPHIIIIGAGLAGLTLAQCLRKQGASFEIFDSDNDLTTRHGYAIGVHSITEELVSAIPSDMPPLRESADHLVPLKLEPQICFYGREGPRIGVQNSPDTPCLRLNRLLFRKWLSTNIPIQFGKKLQSVEEGATGVTVYFEDGTSGSGDMLIGADGVNSKVREHILRRPNAEVLNPIKLACIWGETTLSGEAMERQLSLGHSAYSITSKSLDYAIFSGLNKVNEDFSGDYYWYICWDDEDADKPDHWIQHATKPAKLDHILKMTESLKPGLREIFLLTSAEKIVSGMPVFRDAIIPSLPNTGRVTVLGDAVHPMTPCEFRSGGIGTVHRRLTAPIVRGEGGMHAIQDALNLGKVMESFRNSYPNVPRHALESYHQEMLERGHRAVKLSRNALKINREQDSVVVAWGSVATPIPEEKITLDQCKL
ncbi:FAD/NAD(P)-binding domain-containing protein [Xylaria sp. FL0064]|nr:FAD/NAD(P)-binding domain-containing protein [Xylaria sp. FL0064]